MLRITPAKVLGFCVSGYFAGFLFATIYTVTFCLIYVAIGNNTR